MKEYAIAFPGQGSQYIGMGKDLYMHNKVARETFEEAGDVLGYDLCKLCFEGDIDELSKIDIVQPAILTTSVASYKVLMQEVEQKPAYLLGDSLGEISALVCSGAINFRDAIKIAYKRGKLMGGAAIESGYMIAIMGLDLDVIEDICHSISSKGHIVEISNVNSEEQIVISGNNKAVDEAIDQLKKLGGRIMRINTGNPFHCSLMNPVRQELLEELLQYSYHPFQYPVISNLSALPYQDKEDIPYYLSEQLVKTVRWKESIDYISNQKIFSIIEMKPQTVIRSLLMTNNLNIDVYSYDDKKDRPYIEKITTSISNYLTNNTNENKNNLIQMCISVIASTKNSNWVQEDYSENVVEAYNRLIKIQKDLVCDDCSANYEDMDMSLKLLLKALKAKKINPDNQYLLIKDLLYKTGLFDFFESYIKEGMIVQYE